MKVPSRYLYTIQTSPAHDLYITIFCGVGMVTETLPVDTAEDELYTTTVWETFEAAGNI
jgi:hypothetical protein